MSILSTLEFISDLLKILITLFFNTSSVKPIFFNVSKTNFASFSIFGFDKSWTNNK